MYMYVYIYIYIYVYIHNPHLSIWAVDFGDCNPPQAPDRFVRPAAIPCDSPRSANYSASKAVRGPL